MKAVILLLLFMHLTLLFSLSQAAFTSSLLNPSTTSKALGGVTGVANPWSGDPLNAWSNPAMVAYQEGFRIGYTNDRYAEGNDWMGRKMYHNATYGSYGRNGLGVSFPLLNTSSLFGSTFDYGKLGDDPFYGDSSSSRHSYDTCSELSVAYDPFFRLNKTANTPIVQALNASFGLSMNMLSSDWVQYSYDPESFDTIENITAKAYPLNAGILLRFDGKKYFSLNNLDIQASFGWSRSNILSTKIRYENASSDDYLPEDHRIGCGLFMGIPTTNMFDAQTPIAKYSLHLVSLLIMQGAMISKFDEDENGDGVEIGLLDVLFIRMGRHNVIGDSYQTVTSGMGLKFHYKHWEVQFNDAGYSNWSYDNQHSQDIAIAYTF